MKESVQEKPRDLTDAAKNKAARENGRSGEFCVKDPVNPITGEVVLTQTDFELPWRLPLAWTRQYGSQSDYEGFLGPGWQSPADARLEVDKDGLVSFFDGSPKGAVFPGLPDNEPVQEVADGAVLEAEEEHYLVRLKSGLNYRFAKDLDKGCSPVTEMATADGRRLRFIRLDGNLVEIRGGGESVAVECELGRIVQLTYKDRPLVRYHYRGNELIAAADSLGHARRFDYESGRLIRHTDKNNLSFHYRYDDRGRCIHTHGDNGLYGCDLEYDLYHGCTRTIDIPSGAVTSFFYGKNKLPLKVQDPTGAETSYEYDELGRVVKVIDPLERITKYKYDQAGNVTEISRPDYSRMAFVYEENRPVRIMDPNDGIWEQRFDEKGRLIEKTSPLGHTTGYTYDRRGDLAGVTDANERTTVYRWDDDGRIESMTTPGGKTTHYRHDPLGNITGITDPAGRTTEYSYDAKSRLLAAVSPTGLKQSFEWDPEDNLLLHTDAAGRRTHFEYTGVNEIARRINPDGTSVQYHYDNEERLTGLTNEKGQTYRFAYDGAGRVTTRTDYFGHSHNYSYDAAGQLVKSTDPLDRTVSYSYDPTGRLTEKIFESEEREVFNWDAAGNLIGFQSSGGECKRLFDADGRLIGEKSQGFEVNYTFDSAGQLTERKTSCGNRIGYGYDDSGAVTEIRINDHQPIRFERDGLGRITGEQLSKNLTRSSAYDDEGRLVHQRSGSADTQIERWYDYDPAGQLIGRKDSAKGTMHFDYDPMGRLVEAIDPMGKVNRFDYDPAGDLLKDVPDSTSDLRETRYKNRTYRFDPAGNLVDRLQNGELTRFQWDEQNRLHTIRTGDDKTVRMAYDALGRRVQKSVNGERTFFAWDGDALLAEKFEDQPAREYVYYPGTFEPLAVIDAGGVYYYHNDVNGLPLELTTPGGEIVWSASYDAMGRVGKLLVNDVAQPLRLQGQYYDPEIDLCYNRYRYFDPHTCSFISQDPLGLAAGENVYAYAPNVWGWVDPLGLCKEASKRGPKPFGTGSHNKKIKEIADSVTDGDVIAGGQRLPEARIDTFGGKKSSRRPDILVKRPDGSKYGINVGKTTKSGVPIKREVEAIYDLEEAGLDMHYVPYD
jgi:RHS repeat-associated protein